MFVDGIRESEEELENVKKAYQELEDEVRGKKKNEFADKMDEHKQATHDHAHRIEQANNEEL